MILFVAGIALAIVPLVKREGSNTFPIVALVLNCLGLFGSIFIVVAGFALGAAVGMPT